MKEKTKNEGTEKCAIPHDLRAISHSQHNGNAKKGFLLRKPLMKNSYKRLAYLFPVAMISSPLMVLAVFFTLAFNSPKRQLMLPP